LKSTRPLTADFTNSMPECAVDFSIFHESEITKLELGYYKSSSHKEGHDKFKLFDGDDSTWFESLNSAAGETFDGNINVPGSFYFTRVRIKNKLESNYYANMQGVLVTVGGITCGSMPDTLDDNTEWYDIVCPYPLYGPRFILTST
jgi:hypothetical protein